MTYRKTTYNPINTSENLACSFFSYEEKSCTEAYRFGFNGAELENEIYGEGNAYDLGLRMYDARLARMFSIDPRAFEYPWQSPYVYHRNSPIAYIDFMGGGDPNMSKEQINEKVTALKIQYQRMIWNARAVGAHVAAANLQHFLDGSGSPRTLSASWLRSYSVVRKGEERIKGYFQDKNVPSWASGMKVGQTINRSDYWEAAINSYSPFNELSYASGGSNIRAYGDFSLTKTGSNTISVSGTVTMNWNDPYDWHEGLGFGIPGSGYIDDADALFLEEHGGANSFDMQSSWEYSFSGTYNTKTGEWSDVNWEYKGQVSPSSGESGSGEATRRDNRREYSRDRDQRRTRENTRRQ